MSGSGEHRCRQPTHPVIHPEVSGSLLRDAERATLSSGPWKSVTVRDFRSAESWYSKPSGDCIHFGSNGTESDSAPAIVRDLTGTLAERHQLIRGQAFVNFMQTGRPEYFDINRGDRSQAKM